MAIVTTAFRRGKCWRDTLHLQLRNEEQLGSVLSACAEARWLDWSGDGGTGGRDAGHIEP